MSTLPLLKIRAAAAISTLTLALASTALRAQMPVERSLVNVPFAFQVGSTHFAPGTYTLSSPGDYLVYVQGEKHSALAISSHGLNSVPASASKVIFHRYGNQYFLSEIWMKGDIDHLYCPPSRAEQEAKRSESGDARASVEAPANVEVSLQQSPR